MRESKAARCDTVSLSDAMFPGDTLYSSDAAKAVNFGEPPSVLLLQFQIIKKTIIQRKGLEF